MRPTVASMSTRSNWPARALPQIGGEAAGGDKMGILIITHHDKLLDQNVPDFTHVMLGGKIVETGGVELAHELYTDGYDRIRATYPEAAAAEEEMTEAQPA